MKSLCVAFLCAAAVGAAQEQTLAAQKAGRFEVGLRVPPDGLYAGEEMQIEFRVVDTSQVDPVLGPTPVIRARTRSEIHMPAMPGMAKLVETAHVEGVPGEYGVHPTFPHGGEYRMELTIEPPGGEPFRVGFPLQVADTPSKKRKAAVRPWSVVVRPSPKSPRAGEPAELEISIRHKDNERDPHREFDIQHERKMHLLIVRSDLGLFAHEHPDQQPDGTFRLRYVFPRGGEYRLFADVAPRGAGSQVLLAKIRVGGDAGEKFEIAGARPNGETAAGSLSVRLQSPPPSEQPARKTIPLTFEVKDTASNAPATDLELYLGALGHLILIHADAETFVHSHPDELDPANGKAGVLRFLARFPKEGMYRGWIQLQRGGTVHTGSVLLRASDPARAEAP